MPPIPPKRANPGWPRASPKASGPVTVSAVRAMSSQGTGACFGARIRTSQSGAIGSSRLGPRPYDRAEARWEVLTVAPFPRRRCRPQSASDDAGGPAARVSGRCARPPGAVRARPGGATAPWGPAPAATRAAAACTGAAARRAPRRRCPPRPARRGSSTAIRSASRSTTARSWLMNSAAKPNSRLQLGEQLQHPGLHRDVERARSARRRSAASGRARAPGPGWRAAAGRRRARAGTGRRTPRGSCTASSSSSTRRAGRARASAPGRARPAARRRTRRWSAAG